MLHRYRNFYLTWHIIPDISRLAIYDYFKYCDYKMFNIACASAKIYSDCMFSIVHLVGIVP